MSRFITINLADVPPPDIIEVLNLDTIKTQLINDAVARLNAAGIAYNVGSLESDPVAKVLEAAAYREGNLRQRINDMAKALMLASSWGTNLDGLGVLMDTPRATVSAVAAVAAKGTVTFTSNPNTGEGLTIGTTTLLFSLAPAGPNYVQIAPSLAQTLANLMTVIKRSTDAQITSCTYDLSGFVLSITAATAGAAGNTIALASSVNGSTVSGTTLTGGADAVAGAPETDDSYKSRIQLAPEAFSVAGPEGAYIYFAKQQLGPQGAIDASVKMTKPGYVLVTVMMNSTYADFQPTQDQLNSLYAFLTSEDVKPTTDIVSVGGPKIVPVAIQAVLTLYPGPDAKIVNNSAINSLNALTASEQKLGRSLSRSQIIGALQVGGVFSVNLISPPQDVDLDETQVFNVTSVDVSVANARKT